MAEVSPPAILTSWPTETDAWLVVGEWSDRCEALLEGRFADSEAFEGVGK